MKVMRIAVVVIACMFMAGLVHADVWGVRVSATGGSNQIVNINPFTGAVGQTWTAPNYAAGNTKMGLAGWTNELFYTNTNAENDKVYVVDPTNGSVTRSFTVSGGWNIDGLGYYSDGVTDYLYTSGCVVEDVHRYDAVNGANPTFYWSNIFNPLTMAGDNGGRIFTVGWENNLSGRFGIWEINPQINTAATWFANAPNSSIVGGAFDGTYLYLSDALGELFTYNTSGDLVNTLQLGYNIYGLGSTEGVPSVPEPGTVLLISIGLAGLAAMKKMR